MRNFSLTLMTAALLTTACASQATKESYSQEANRSATYTKGGTGSGTTDNVLSISAGPAVIISKVYTPIGTYSRVSGLDVLIEYKHFGDKTFGYGCTYTYNQTSFLSGTDKLKMHYIGPSLFLSRHFFNKWRFEAGMSAGYACYSERFQSAKSGFGYLSKAGIEYKISELIGIGIETNCVVLRFSTPEGVQLEENERFGFGRINFLGGLRFYF